MTSKLSLSSSISSATLVAINSIGATTVAADDKQNHHAVVVAAVATDDPLKVVSVEQHGITSAAVKQTKRGIETVGQFLDNADREDRLFTPKSSTATALKPDVGILSKDFFKNKGRAQPVDKQFTIHRKRQTAAADVDVGILSNGGQGGEQWRQQQASRANLDAMNEVRGRSLQSEEELPYMCPKENGRGGYWHFPNLFNKTDSPYFTEEGYFPKCTCPSPTTCGPKLCECLELDAGGDILQCMDPFNQLCEGTKYISGIPGPWSMEECLGSKRLAVFYCSVLPCFVDGGSWWECRCNVADSMCTEYRFDHTCAKSKCCQAQTDDEGRKACFYEGWQDYYEENHLSISDEEMISRFNECSLNSADDKSIVECYCESFSYGQCVNSGVVAPDLCEAMNCCWDQTEDDARLDCFTTRFRHGRTGSRFYRARDELQQSCIASGRSSDQCKCDIQGLSNCTRGVGVYDEEGNRINWEPRCDLFQCCQSQAAYDDDDGRKDCLVQDEVQLVYERCINDGNTTETCYCDKSNTLCSSGHSNDQHCELSSCCEEQADNAGRKECIGNFTTSQPSSAPSEAPTEDSIAEASPTAASALPGTSSAIFGVKSPTKTTSKMLAVAAMIGWLLFS